MADYLQVLWDYYSKDKRALKIEDRVYDEKGEPKNLNTDIGDFWNTVKDGNTSLSCNCYVSSIEYILEQTAQPRVIIATEYPASPIKTRKRQIRWASPRGGFNPATRS